MKRFGYAIRIGGDAEISGALAAGMERGTRVPYPPLTRVLLHGPDRPHLAENSPPDCFPGARCHCGGEALGSRAKEALGPRAKEGLRRVAMYQHSPEEWAEMIEDARVIYGGQRETPKPLQWLVVGYAVICTTIERCYRYMSAWNREG